MILLVSEFLVLCDQIFYIFVCPCLLLVVSENVIDLYVSRFFSYRALLCF